MTIPLFRDPLKTIRDGLSTDDLEEVAALVNRLKWGAARKKVSLATYIDAIDESAVDRRIDEMRREEKNFPI